MTGRPSEPDRSPAAGDGVAEAHGGALVGAAVGDGVGAPFEGRRGPVPLHEIDRFAATAPLRTTDDTAMTIGVAESLLHRGGLDEDHLAATFAAAYARDPHRGYGAGAAGLLQRIAAGDDWRPLAAAQFGGQGSFGNGAAMRSAPFGLHAAGHPQHAAELARRAALVTHTHPLGVEGAAAHAAAVALLVTAPGDTSIHGPRLVATLNRILTSTELCAMLETAAEIAADATPEQVARTLGTGVAAVEAVPAAFCAFLRHQDSFPDTVRFAISLGGDTDTIASMAGSLTGALRGLPAIPPDWVARTEGARKLVRLADRFAQRHDGPS